MPNLPSSRPYRIAPALVVVLVASSVVACGGGGAETLPAGPDGDAHATVGATGGQGGVGDDGPMGQGGGDDVTLTTTGAGAACEDGCASGICRGGVCCAGAASACSDVCCGDGEVCLFDRCVAPGASCLTANDCGEGAYCETGLDGGAPAPAPSEDPACSLPLPVEGRCLALPPTCAPGEDASTGDCRAACEFHPEVGALDAVRKWTWGVEGESVSVPDHLDVWSTPTVARMRDANCDGAIDLLDPPTVVFVAGRSETPDGVGTCCSCENAIPGSCKSGVLRAVDGATGREVWSLERAAEGSVGFAGVSTALGDLDGDGRVDIAALTGEGRVVVLDADGRTLWLADEAADATDAIAFGWGGGLAIADMDADGHPEIAFGRSVYTTRGDRLERLFVGTAGRGGQHKSSVLTAFVDLDGDGLLELLAGRTAYRVDGSTLWDRADLPDGFTATGDLDGDGEPEIVLVAEGDVRVLDGATGLETMTAIHLPGTGSGGPPTIANFDGEAGPEIGVAQSTLYSVLKPNAAADALEQLWAAPNHDLSSSVTGSSVFDFEGDGRAEVVYNDECFLWVYDGATGAVRFATPTTSFTATEASIVADVDGDGHAEIVMVSNGASPTGWKCDVAPWNEPDPALNRPAWTPPAAAPAYRGISVFADRQNAWVGTRTIWNQHGYHVTNICDDRDAGCDGPNVYGSIPRVEKRNWTEGWLNNYRQNVQDRGIFDAPDAVVNLAVRCEPTGAFTAEVRNAGAAALPAGTPVAVERLGSDGDVEVARVATTRVLFPGQTESLGGALDHVTSQDAFRARVLEADAATKFRQCRVDNDASEVVAPTCLQ